MEYLDEQLLALKRQQKREQYHSLETGFYIHNELVEFERVVIEPLLLSIMLPTTFVTMPQSMVKVKYQSENRPQVIKTSLDTRVNFTFSLLSQPIRPEQITPLAKQFKTVVQRVSPANVFYDLKEEQTGAEVPLCWFDYKGYAVDEQIYYMMYVTPWGSDKLLHGTFNCRFRDKDEWKEAARQAILSLKMEEGDKNS